MSDVDLRRTLWWTVPVPAELALDHALCPGARRFYMRLADGPRSQWFSVAEAVRRGGVTNFRSARRYLAALLERGWLTAADAQSRTYRLVVMGPPLPLPGLLVHHPTLGAAAVCVYASLAARRLQSGAWLTGRRPDVLAATGFGSNTTVRQCLEPLQAGGWLEIQFISRADGTTYILHDPHLAARRLERRRSRARLSRAPYFGEALMAEMLVVTVEDDRFIRNARPARLANPLTGEPLELDVLFDQAKVAFEFNGPQHDHVTELFPEAPELARQQVRDAIKLHLSSQLGITLVSLTRRDLRFSTLRERLQGVMPLRPWRRQDPVAQMLDAESRRHRSGDAAAQQDYEPPGRM